MIDNGKLYTCYELHGAFSWGGGICAHEFKSHTMVCVCHMLKIH